MRKIFKIIKENFYVIILLLGVGLFINGLFSFGSSSHKGITEGVASSGKKFDFSTITYPIATYYHYGPASINNLTIGAILIVFGLVKIRKKKDEN